MTSADFPGIIFLNIKNLDTFLEEKPVLYKYMPLEHALITLSKKQFWLSDPKKWPDPFEARFLKAKYSDTGGNEIDSQFQNGTFATCLTRERYNEAQWIAYSKESIAVRFDIDTKILLEQLSQYAIKNSFHVYFGQVEYHKKEDIEVKNINMIPFDAEKGKGAMKICRDVTSPDFCARLLLLKRQDFAYENEMRIIVIKDIADTSKGTFFKYYCDNKDLIRSLMISPKAEEQTVSMLKEYIAQKFDLPPKVDKNGVARTIIQRYRLYDEENDAKITV